MELTVLGSSGSYPGPQSACSSYLVSRDGYNLLLDAGNGSMANLFGACSPAELDAIFISHSHSDHWADLIGIYYYCLFADRPKRPITLVTSTLVVELLLAQIGKTNLLPVFEVDVLARPDNVKLGPLECVTDTTGHSVPTYAIRIQSQGKVLTYTADTGESIRVQELATGSDLLIAECTWSLGHKYQGPPLHHDPATLASLIVNARPNKTLITHVAYPNDRLEVAKQVRSLAEGCEVLVAHDNMSITVGV